MPETISRQYSIHTDHPCLAGHFPGNPLVPGVVILDYIRHLVRQWKPNSRIVTISQAKFQRPLFPEQKFIIKLVEKNKLTIKFTCFRANEVIASGLFTIANHL